MWKVTVILQNLNGEVNEMNYLTAGDKFEAIHSTMAAIAHPDDKWVKTLGIRIDKVEED
jgi:hypothetical protein